MNMGINEFIVVEDRDDIKRVRTAVECDTVEADGSAINRETLAVIQNVQETRGVVVLTDPDFLGDRIRNIIIEHVPEVKHAYVDRERAKNKHGKIGMERTHPDGVKTVLMHVNSPFEEGKESIDKSVLIDLGLIIDKDARRKREILGRKLHIGHSNGKQLLKKLNAFGYTEEDVRRALSMDKENK